MEKLNGVWKIESSEKFDEYMQALGVGIVMRKAGAAAKPVLTIECSGKSIYFKSVSTFRTIETKATLDSEYDEETPDGRKCKTTFSMSGDKLVQLQKWDGKQGTVTRYLDGSGALVMDLEVGDVKAKRVYKKQ